MPVSKSYLGYSAEHLSLMSMLPAWATEEEKSSERISNNSKNSLWEKPKFSCISMAFCLFGITQFYSETIKGWLAK